MRDHPKNYIQKLGVYTVQDRHPVDAEFAANPKNKRTVITAVKHHRMWNIRGQRTPSKVSA